VLAQAISNGGIAEAAGQAIAVAYRRNPSGVTTALANALSIANNDAAKTDVAASSVTQVRTVHVL
jgi:hypothetical protein